MWYTEMWYTEKVHPADELEVYTQMSFQNLTECLPCSMHFAQQCLQIKQLHHGTYCKKYRGNKRKSLCKKCFPGYLYSTCSRPGVILLVKQRAGSEIHLIRPTQHSILLCFVPCTKCLPCRSLHDSSSHSKYSCTVVMAHKPAWICIPQEGMFFIVFCTAVLLLIGTSCCPWGKPWDTARLLWVMSTHFWMCGY